MNTTGNIVGTGQMFQTLLQKKFLENFEPELRFWQLGRGPVSSRGYESVSRPRMRRSEAAPASALLTEGITPSDTDLKIDTVTVKPTQYGQVATITDILEDTTLLRVVSEGMSTLAKNGARIIDQVIQNNLSANATNFIYGGSATATAMIGATDTITASNVAQANAFLSTKAAPTIGGSYVAVAHPNVIYDLQMETGQNTWIEVNKYTDHVKKIFNGEIGTLFGVRFIRSAFIQTIASTVTVYPTYVMGAGAYGVTSLQSFSTHFVPRKDSDSDPLAQRSKVGWKCAFASIILQDDALVILQTASALDYKWGS